MGKIELKAQPRKEFGLVHLRIPNLIVFSCRNGDFAKKPKIVPTKIDTSKSKTPEYILDVNSCEAIFIAMATLAKNVYFNPIMNKETFFISGSSSLG